MKGEQCARVRRPKNVREPLFDLRRTGKDEGRSPVVRERKRYARISERERTQERRDAREFRGRRAQKLTPRRHVCEQLGDDHARPRRRGQRLRIRDGAGVGADRKAYLASCGSRNHPDARDRSDRS